MVCGSDPSLPVFGVNVCRAALFTGRSRVWESVPKEAVHETVPRWCDSRWDASRYLETIEHISIFSSPILSLNLKPGQPKGEREMLFENFFFFRVLFWNPGGKAWLRPSQPLSCKTFQTKTWGFSQVLWIPANCLSFVPVASGSLSMSPASYASASASSSSSSLDHSFLYPPPRYAPLHTWKEGPSWHRWVAADKPRSGKGKRLSGKGHLVMFTFSSRVPPCSLPVTLVNRSQEFACV